MTKILMVASEAAPFAKTGGLADVLGSLPAALAPLGVEAAVLLPRYRGIPIDAAQRAGDFPIWLAGSNYRVTLYRIQAGATFYFADCPALYDRDGYYGNAKGDFPDNAVRFAVLARAALEMMRGIFRPRILHCHDWQSGLAPVYLKTTFARDPTFIGVRTLFTIHNLGYQGIFAPDALAQVGLDRGVFHPGGIEFFGDVSFMKGGLNFSDALSTVSARYALEIQTPEYGFGLDGVLRARSSVLHGILNGVDYSQWNPATDPHIAAHYGPDDLSGKRACKLDLIRTLGLDEAAIDRPLLGVVSRLASQKGADLIVKIADALAADDLYLAVLGKGEADLEAGLVKVAAAHPGRIQVHLGYDETLAHKIEAGADIFLMPSRYEPSGLNQMYSLRYGTVPVVRSTGGLDDTIDEDTGFKFHEPSAWALLQATRAAAAAFSDRESWTARMRLGMGKDFSWQASAAAYSNLYQRLLSGRADG
ncbi:MAG: glycogen synthase GlgA [Candidatus Solibacter usitatus]|nr:glycogen synthase GlgA [Candidatus Solibacter usitatus]